MSRRSERENKGRRKTDATVPAKSRCRYCGSLVEDKALADHIKNQCSKAPKT